MSKYNIPTARYKNFSTYADAGRHIDEVEYPIVIKATGLAAGKGVIIPKSKTEAHDALNDIMVKKIFGEAGEGVVIEEWVCPPCLDFHCL